MADKQEPYRIEQLAINIFCIHEKDYCNHNPLMYLIIGTKKALLLDTGCGTGNLYKYLEDYFGFVKQKKSLVVVNTHNHPEQISNNWQFSPVGFGGLANNVEALCASNRNSYYTNLHDNQYDWQVKPYKVTKWLSDEEVIKLGDQDSDQIEVLHTPGHTPDSLTLWYASAGRFFVGGLLHRYSDVLLTFVLRYSSVVSDVDSPCLPNVREFQRFLISILAGTLSDDAVCYHNRGNGNSIFGFNFLSKLKI
ncbi:unnamed protein product [Thelazia callipaeda]|uniref:Lactamase_B domain-containing protein n=1 Tax=Thelazia callipaeda TaxID=103827 RepID=A0A0N5CQ17_THECL|nr:unnamed protein product [Thelazia callipaeda]